MSIQEFPEVGVDAPEVTPRTIKRELDDGNQLTILDTRGAESYKAWHIEHPNATTVNIPFTAFMTEENEPVSTMPDGVPDGALVTCCAKGISSKFVADVLTRDGREVRSIAGGMEGWARLYERTTVNKNEEYTLYQYHRPSSGCLSYLLVSGSSAIVIDPLDAFVDRYIQDADDVGATLAAALDTHVHADHVSGVRRLAEDHGVTPYMPYGADERGLSFRARLVKPSSALTVGNATLTALSLAGHTSEMLGLYVDGYIVSGDTVFSDGVARPDLEAENRAKQQAAELYDTIQRLVEEHNNTVLLPGHVSSFVARDETVEVPVGRILDDIPLAAKSKEDFISQLTENLPPAPNSHQTIIRLNLGLASVDAGTRFELELGPNNCGV